METITDPSRTGDLLPTLMGHLVQPPQRDPVQLYLDTLTPASRLTMRTCLRAVARVARAISPDDIPWGNLRDYHVEYIRGTLIDRAAAPATVNLTLAALRGVSRRARNLGLMSQEDYQRICEVKPHKGERLPAGRSVATGELTALLDACVCDQTRAGIRDTALLAVLYIGGLRRAELASLTREDYVPDPPAVRVLRGKGDKDRLVPLEQTAARVIDAWLAVRGDREGGLFLPINRGDRIYGVRMTPEAVYQIVQKRAVQARIIPLSPHDLRRTFVGDLLDAGVDISTVQKLAGHAQVTTTARYDRRGEAAKRKAVERLHLPLRYEEHGSR